MTRCRSGKKRRACNSSRSDDDVREYPPTKRSRKAEKRAEQRLAGTVSVTQNPNVGIKINSPRNCTSPSGSQATNIPTQERLAGTVSGNQDPNVRIKIETPPSFISLTEAIDIPTQDPTTGIWINTLPNHTSLSASQETNTPTQEQVPQRKQRGATKLKASATARLVATVSATQDPNIGIGTNTLPNCASLANASQAIDIPTQDPNVGIKVNSPPYHTLSSASQATYILTQEQVPQQKKRVPPKLKNIATTILAGTVSATQDPNIGIGINTSSNCTSLPNASRETYFPTCDPNIEIQISTPPNPYSPSASQATNILAQEQVPQQKKRGPTKTMNIATTRLAGIVSAAQDPIIRIGINAPLNCTSLSIASQATEIPTQDPNSGIRINTPPNHTSSNDSQATNIPTQEQVSHRKKRGPTKMKKIAMTAPLEVQFNERGQPIGPNSICLSSFLGSIAREMVSITKEKWTHVTKDEKEKLWSYVQQRFIIPDHHKNYILMELGQLWRTWKSRTTKLLKNAIESGATEDEISNQVKPNEVSDQEWVVFRTQRSSPKFIEMSKRFQELRAKQKLSHTMSRKGYARLEDEMRAATAVPSDICRVDLWVQGHTKKGGQPCNDAVAETMEVVQELQAQSSSSSSYSIRKDPLAQVFGAEHHGRVRGLGFGATLTKVGATTQPSALVTNLQRQVNDLKSQYDHLANMLVKNQNQDQQGRTKEGCAPTAQNCMRCTLLDWTGKSRVVAKGKVTNKDPTCEVEGIPIGPSAWMIWVSRVFEPSAFLWRTRSDMRTLGKALGDTVAWPIEYIEMEDI